MSSVDQFARYPPAQREYQRQSHPRPHQMVIELRKTKLYSRRHVLAQSSPQMDPTNCYAALYLCAGCQVERRACDLAIFHAGLQDQEHPAKKQLAWSFYYSSRFGNRQGGL